MENKYEFNNFMKKYNINNYYIASLMLVFGIYFVYINYNVQWIITTETIKMYSAVK